MLEISLLGSAREARVPSGPNCRFQKLNAKEQLGSANQRDNSFTEIRYNPSIIFK